MNADALTQALMFCDMCEDYFACFESDQEERCEEYLEAYEKIEKLLKE